MAQRERVLVRARGGEEGASGEVHGAISKKRGEADEGLSDSQKGYGGVFGGDRSPPEAGGGCWRRVTSSSEEQHSLCTMYVNIAHTVCLRTTLRSQNPHLFVATLSGQPSTNPIQRRAQRGDAARDRPLLHAAALAQGRASSRRAEPEGSCAYLSHTNYPLSERLTWVGFAP